MPKMEEIYTFYLYVGISSNISVFRHCVLDLNNTTEKNMCYQKNTTCIFKNSIISCN